MKKSLTSLLLFFSFFQSFLSYSFAQSGTLKGSIHDAVTGEALIAATVQAGETGTTSDFNGQYILRLGEGEYVVQFSYVGYETLRKNIVIEDGQTLTLDIVLGESPTLLKTATVSSSKYEKPLGEVSVSLEVLKASLIDNTNATNITQPLQKISGVNIIDGQANIRGGSGWSYGAGSRVLLLVDDIPALQADAGFPNWVDIPVENIAQVEIVKGAASALYGSSALNGIINVRTAYATVEPYTKVSTFFKYYDAPKRKSLIWWDEEITLYHEDSSGDSTVFKPSFFGEHKGYNKPAQLGLSVTHRQKLGKTDLLLGSYALWDEHYRQGNYSQYARFNAGIKHRINDHLSLGFNSNFNRGIGRSVFYWRDIGSGDDNPGTYLPDTTAFSNSNRFRFTVDPYLTYLGNNGIQHKVLSRYYGIINKNDNKQSNSSQLYYGEYQLLKSFEDIAFNITTGLVGTWTKVDAELYNGIYHSANYAGYIQLDKKFFDKLNLSLGARYEFNQLKNPDFYFADTIVFAAGANTDAQPVFRAGLNYQAAEYTFFRASWGQGYRYPVIAEKYILTRAGGINVIPNPKLKPETGWSAELGIKQGFRIANLNGFLDVAFFRNDYKDMMEFGLQFDPVFGIAFQSNNIGNTTITGIDLSIAGEGSFGEVKTSVLTGYTYINPKYKDYDPEEFDKIITADYNVLKYRSRHSVKFDVESSYRKCSLGFSTIYNSRIEAIDPIIAEVNNIGLYLDEYQPKGFSKVDLRFSFRPNKKWKLSLLADNLLNREYVVRPGLLEAPRSFSLRVDWQL